MATVTNSTAAITLKTRTRFGVSIESHLAGQRLLTIIVYVNGCWPRWVPGWEGGVRAPEGKADRPPLGKDEGRDPDRGPRAVRRLRLRAGDHSRHRRGRGNRPGDGDAVLRQQGEALRRGGRVRSAAARPGGRAARGPRLRGGGAVLRPVGER